MDIKIINKKLTSEASVVDIIKYLIDKGISYVYIPESKELHFEDCIYRFTFNNNVTISKSQLVKMVVKNSDNIQYILEQELPFVGEVMNSITLDDNVTVTQSKVSFPQYRTRSIKKENRMINQRLKRNTKRG